jgi:hypothetical protein
VEQAPVVRREIVTLRHSLSELRRDTCRIERVGEKLDGI